MKPATIEAADLRSRMASPEPPLLVLAYEDDKPFRTFGIEGAVPFSQFKAQLPAVRRDREIVFY